LSRSIHFLLPNNPLHKHTREKMTSLESLVQQLKSITGDSADSGAAPSPIQPQPVTPPILQPVQSAPKSSRSLWMIGGLVVVGVLVGVGFWFKKQGQHSAVVVQPPAAAAIAQPQRNSSVRKQVRFEDEEVDELETFSPIPIEQT
jgi:uncharacterized membrane protein YebE (DUF533 family)